MVLNALLTPGDLVLFDRNNHKSNHHGALLQAGATPIYLETARNPYGFIGGIDAHCFEESYLRELVSEVAPNRAKSNRPFRLAVIQLGTYDGTIYNARQVVDKIGHLCGVLWICTVANFGGARITGQISSITAWGVIIPVVGLCIIGWFWFSPTLYANSWNPHHVPFFSAVGSSIAMTLWAFLGLESACANAEVVENPERNVPIAVLGGTLGAAVIYIISTNVIAGIVPNMELANSTAPFGLAFAQMFTPEVGKVIMALMVMSCCGSLLGWQFTIAQVFKSSADEGYFPKIFSRVTKVDAPVQGMLAIVVIQSGLSLMTISPSLNNQFNVLVNLAVVTNIIPYILSMAALVIIQRMANVNPTKAKAANIVAFIGALYSFYALYSSGEEAMLYGSIVTFLGWTLYGLVSPRFELKNKHG